jgi:hypothetical protein
MDVEGWSLLNRATSVVVDGPKDDGFLVARFNESSYDRAPSGWNRPWLRTEVPGYCSTPDRHRVGERGFSLRWTSHIDSGQLRASCWRGDHCFDQLRSQVAGRRGWRVAGLA